MEMQRKKKQSGKLKKSQSKRKADYQKMNESKFYRVWFRILQNQKLIYLSMIKMAI